jgi:DNA repair protein RadC
MIIVTARDAADLFEPFFAKAPQEKVVVAYLGEGQRVLATGQYPGGGKDEVGLPVRAIIGEALRLDAEAILLAHNHPSGDPQPSKADIAATRELAATAASLGIRLYDHLIFAKGECRSLRGLGLL